MYYNMGQVATQLRCTYENVRKQFNRYKDNELKGHWKKNGRQYLLDEEALGFLRNNKPINITVLENESSSEKIAELENQVKGLLLALNESQAQFIELQTEYTTYLKENAQTLALSEKAESLKNGLIEANNTIAELQTTVETIEEEKAKALEQLEEAQAMLEAEQNRKLTFTERLRGKKH